MHHCPCNDTLTLPYTKEQPTPALPIFNSYWWHKYMVNMWTNLIMACFLVRIISAPALSSQRPYIFLNKKDVAPKSDNILCQVKHPTFCLPSLKNSYNYLKLMCPWGHLFFVYFYLRWLRNISAAVSCSLYTAMNFESLLCIQIPAVGMWSKSGSFTSVHHPLTLQQYADT